MIGIVLLELLIILNIKNNLDISDNEYNLILKFIKKLIEPNNKKRYSVDKAYESYKKLINFYIKKIPPERIELSTFGLEGQRSIQLS